GPRRSFLFERYGDPRALPLSLHDALPIWTWLDISTVSSWGEIVRWYSDLARPRCVPDAAIRAKAAELTRDAKTETEKINAIGALDRKSTRLNSSHDQISYAVFCLKKKKRP